MSLVRFFARFGCALALVLAVVPHAQADVKLPGIIGSNMVLQAGKPLPIWGWAEPNEQVTVTIAGQTASATAGADGKWSVTLNPLAAAGAQAMTVKGKNELKLTNILIGEVWVCSGQSNMEWSVQASKDPAKEIAAANYPEIRLFHVPRLIADKAVDDVNAKWVVCSPETIASFSAVGYFFGRELNQKLHVPVGLIATSWGGTPAESWTTEATMAAHPDLKPMVERLAKSRENFPAAMAAYEKATAEYEAKWLATLEKYKKEGIDPPPKPKAPQKPSLSSGAGTPSVLYNGMIHPLAPFVIQGAIWYQGESNAGRAYQYRELLPAMITDWRKVWKQGDFPFLIVSLANYLKVVDEPGDSTWAELREAQTLTTKKLPKVGQALAIDIGEANDIHPKNKQEVGRRLALAAEKIAYGKDLVYSGPEYDSMKVEGSGIRLTFKQVGSGLMAKGDKLTGFAIAGDDKKFYWADARIDGNSIVVSSDKVAMPKAVRYAWADNPVCNLYNREGLPAVPFRTDDWEGKTFAAR